MPAKKKEKFEESPQPTMPQVPLGEVEKAKKVKVAGLPPIHQRYMALMETDTNALVQWVSGLGEYKGVDITPASKKALCAAILVSEYGPDEYVKWRLDDDQERK